MGTFRAPVVRPLGDSALSFEFGDAIDPATNARVLAAWRAVEALQLDSVEDVVPAYATLTVHFDPCASDIEALSDLLLEACAGVFPPVRDARCVQVPVCYEQGFAPDMDELCAHSGLRASEVVARHSGADYRVFFLGFTPGFPYLGGLDPALAMPRRETPRTKVEAGSVGIGGAQTGIYPTASPGGWRIIGRTPVRLFDHSRMPPSLLAPGDSVRFVPVSADEFARLSGRG